MGLDDTAMPKGASGATAEAQKPAEAGTAKSGNGKAKPRTGARAKAPTPNAVPSRFPKASPDSIAHAFETGEYPYADRVPRRAS